MKAEYDEQAEREITHILELSELSDGELAWGILSIGKELRWVLTEHSGYVPSMDQVSLTWGWIGEKRARKVSERFQINIPPHIFKGEDDD